MADNSELSAKHDPSIFSSKFTAKETQVPWFIPTVPEPPPEFRALLEANGILPSKVRQHIQTVVCSFLLILAFTSSSSTFLLYLHLLPYSSRFLISLSKTDTLHHLAA